MKRRLVLTLVLLTSSLFAADKVPHLEAGKEVVLDERHNYFLTSTDTRITPKVNPITGEYCEEEVDLVVAGCEPISVRRFYNSTAPDDNRYAKWRYNPECFFVANFEFGLQEIFASIGEADGSVCSYKRSDGDRTLFQFEVPKHFLAFQVDGATHPLNTKIQFKKELLPKDNTRFQYYGTITDGSGRIRSFRSPSHRWSGSIFYREKKGNWAVGHNITYRIHPNEWTPYHVPIVEEKLPNGNILTYKYITWKKEKKDYPLPELLSSITAYNADKSKVLGSIRLEYPRAKNQEVDRICITGSDGRTALVQHNGKKPNQITSAKKPGKPSNTYTHEKNKLNTITKPSGYTVKTEYNKEGKVSAQYAPVGPKGKMCPIGTYAYNTYMTQVVDAEGNKIDYHFDPDSKLLKTIAYLRDHRVYKQEHFERDSETGNLLRKIVADGDNVPLQITEYAYDKNQNPIEEKFGDGKEWRVITRTFSDDGFNLKLSETDRAGKLIYYTYVPGTNLLASELTYDEEKICKRIFHTYDDCAVCIETIVDDGISEDRQDLSGVTYRKITRITPKDTTPCLGLPEIVEERTIDPSGHELLLHKTIYTYTPFGKILQEEHYDADNTHRYTIYNTYDKEERLISKTDPLGAITSFTYDINHNLTSIAGPRSDQLQKITYDKANRPIKITEGDILSTEKVYDKLGRVIQEIDPCGHATSYEYDVLSRVTKISYPDGGVERKEYDVVGNVTKEIDPKGYETLKTYNCFGQPLSINYPDGSREHYTYNPTGTIATYTDKNRATTHYIYDLFDHVVKEEIYSPSRDLLKTTSSTYSPFHKLSETEDDLTVTFNYDFAGRKIRKNAAYQTTMYTYDSLGRLHNTQMEETRVVDEYDLCDRLIETRTESGDVVQKQEGYAYDEAGNQIQKTCSQGSTDTTYDALGRPLMITDPLGFVTHHDYDYDKTLTHTLTNPKGIETVIIYDCRGRAVRNLKKNSQGEVIQQSESSYDNNGNLIALTHSILTGSSPVDFITHTWEYGPCNRIEAFTESGEKETRYLYDTKGQLRTLEKPDGCQIHHEYDELGRLSRYYAHDFDYHYTYDARDRVLKVYDAISDSKTTRSYDPLGLVLREKLSCDLVLSNTYDNRGRRIECTLPDATTIHYAYNGIFLHTVSRGTLAYTYQNRNLEGQITKITSPIGQIEITRDALGRYTTLHAPHFSANSYTYDPTGCLIRYTYEDQKGLQESSYAYDELDQLISETEHTYVFDSLHNRRKKDGDEYEINLLSQVKYDGQSSYSYDSCGNLISDGTRRYTYDSLDRLILVEEEETKTSYTYDAFHRRLSRTAYTNNKQTKHTSYIWDGDEEIGAIDENNTIQELRILGIGLGAEIGAAAFYQLDSKLYVPIHDHRGCVVALIDVKTQNLSGSYRYTAFGEEKITGIPSPWRFSSKRVDMETDLIYFGRRYYNPNLGRFITQDPQGFDDGPNLYAYLHNSPLVQIDPYGLMAFDNFMGFGLSCPTFSWLSFSPGLLDFEGPFTNKSCTYNLNRDFGYEFEEPPIGAFLFGNGVGNGFNSLGEKAHTISTYSGYNTQGVYNATHSIPIDGLEAMLNLAYVNTNPVQHYHNAWDNYFDNDTSGAPLWQACHSQAVPQVRNALESYLPERRERILVAAFAPFAYISDDICMRAWHYVCPSDLVPNCDLVGKLRCKDNITYVEKMPGIKQSCHEFLNPIYLPFIKQEIDDYQNLLRKYEN